MVEVVVYRRERGHLIEGGLGDLFPIQKMPEGGTFVGDKRKFVVIREQNKLLIAIGPLGDSSHKEIVEAVGENDRKVSGGGFVCFAIRVVHGEEYKTANFSGESRQDGKYSPLLENYDISEQIKEAIGLTDIEFD